MPRAGSGRVEHPLEEGLDRPIAPGAAAAVTAATGAEASCWQFLRNFPVNTATMSTGRSRAMTISRRLG
jgi:hypothetical protein